MPTKVNYAILIDELQLRFNMTQTELAKKVGQ